MRWSTVTLFTAFFTLSFMILSNTLPTLLARVIPHSFEHLFFIPLPLYRWIMFPWTQLFEIFSSWWILLMVFDIAILVVSLASMNNSFNIPSGPRLFFLFYFFIAFWSFFVGDIFLSLLVFRVLRVLLSAILDVCCLFYNGIGPIRVLCRPRSCLVEFFKVCWYVVLRFLGVSKYSIVLCDGVVV